MKKKKGYDALLLLTKLLTLIGVLILISVATKAPTRAFSSTHVNFMLGLGIFFILCAGINCVIRKRFFTVRE